MQFSSKQKDILNILTPPASIKSTERFLDSLLMQSRHIAVGSNSDLLKRNTTIHTVGPKMMLILHDSIFMPDVNGVLNLPLIVKSAAIVDFLPWLHIWSSRDAIDHLLPDMTLNRFGFVFPDDELDSVVERRVSEYLKQYRMRSTTTDQKTALMPEYNQNIMAKSEWLIPGRKIESTTSKPIANRNGWYIPEQEPISTIELAKSVMQTQSLNTDSSSASILKTSLVPKSDKYPIATRLMQSSALIASGTIMQAVLSHNTLNSVNLSSNGYPTQAMDQVASSISGMPPNLQTSLNRSSGFPTPMQGFSHRFIGKGENTTPEIHNTAGISSSPSQMQTSNTLSQMGQITLVAPSVKVASEESEDKGSAIAFNWATLTKGLSPLNITGLAALKQALPPEAEIIYPALPIYQLPAGASNLRISSSLANQFLAQGYGVNAGNTGDAASKLAANSLGSSVSTSLPALIVPGKRPAGNSTSLFPTTIKKSGGKNPVMVAGQNQAIRGGVLDFLGMPVRLAPSLSGRSELKMVQAAARAKDIIPKTVRPSVFSTLKGTVFPSFQSIDAEPDKGAWMKAAPSFGLRDASPSIMLGQDSRVPNVTSFGSTPQTNTISPSLPGNTSQTKTALAQNILSSMPAPSIYQIFPPGITKSNMRIPESSARIPGEFGTALTASTPVSTKKKSEFTAGLPENRLKPIGFTPGNTKLLNQSISVNKPSMLGSEVTRPSSSSGLPIPNISPTAAIAVPINNTPRYNDLLSKSIHTSAPLMMDRYTTQPSNTTGLLMPNTNATGAIAPKLIQFNTQIPNLRRLADVGHKKDYPLIGSTSEPYLNLLLNHRPDRQLPAANLNSIVSPFSILNKAPELETGDLKYHMPQMLYTPLAQNTGAGVPAVTLQRAIPSSTAAIRSSSSQNMQGHSNPVFRSPIGAPTVALQRSASGSTSITKSSDIQNKKDTSKSTSRTTTVNDSNEINLLATEVWSILKRKLSTEAERRGMW